MRDAKYWAERALNELLMEERSVLEYEDALLQAYKIALREIQKEIDAFFNRYATQHNISYAEARKRLTTVELKDFQAMVKGWLSEAVNNKWSSEYIQYLENLSKAKYVSRLEMLEADVRYQVEKLQYKKYVDMTELLSVNYLAAYYERAYTIAHGAEIAVRFNAVTRAGVEKAIKTRWSPYNYSQSIWNDRDRLVRSLSTIIPQSFSRGLSSNQLGDMIAKEMEASRHRGRTLARTEVNHICNQADLDVYKVVGVEIYQYLATLDMRTSEICRSLDGTEHKVSHAQVGVNFPPMHPNCRSTTVPKFEDDEDAERVARDEEGKTIRVPRKMTQEQYINTYVPEEDRDRLLSFIRKYYKSE